MGQCVSCFAFILACRLLTSNTDVGLCGVKRRYIRNYLLNRTDVLNDEETTSSNTPDDCLTNQNAGLNTKVN